MATTIEVKPRVWDTDALRSFLVLKAEGQEYGSSRSYQNLRRLADEFGADYDARGHTGSVQVTGVFLAGKRVGQSFSFTLKFEAGQYSGFCDLND